MKIRNLVLGIMTCVAFTACSKDDNGSNGENVLEGDAFVAVNIVSNSSGSRALGNTEEGSNDENKVNSAVFFFFDAEGNGCATPSKPTLDFTDKDGNTSVISKAVIVLSNAKSIPASIVAVMNPSREVSDLGMNTSLASLRVAVAKVTPVGSFSMSNSAYAGANGALMDATPVSSENICLSEAEALKYPVNIAVERVVAKIETTLADATMSDEEFLIDNVKTKIKVQLLGWKATALNPESNLIKNIDPTWTMSWWNDALSFRSFWGISKTTNNYTYFSHDAIAANDAAEYCLENTTATTTKMIVAAELRTAGGAAIDLMEWKGSKNTKENMKTILANTSNVKAYFIKKVGGTENEYVNLPANYIDFTTVGTSEATRYTVIAKLAAGTPEIYTIVNKVATPVTEATVNATLKDLGEIKHWNGGASYFYIDVEHNGGTDMGSHGIIRNHYYKLKVTAVNGLGTPVPNPGEEIIPEKPTTDDASYIAAKVEVLKWKIVTQDVILSDK